MAGRCNSELTALQNKQAISCRTDISLKMREGDSIDHQCTHHGFPKNKRGVCGKQEVHAVMSGLCIHVCMHTALRLACLFMTVTLPD